VIVVSLAYQFPPSHCGVCLNSCQERHMYYQRGLVVIDPHRDGSSRLAAPRFMCRRAIINTRCEFTIAGPFTGRSRCGFNRLNFCFRGFCDASAASTMMSTRCFHRTQQKKASGSRGTTQSRHNDVCTTSTEPFSRMYVRLPRQLCIHS
jgi:hypothetical protein